MATTHPAPPAEKRLDMNERGDRAERRRRALSTTPGQLRAESLAILLAAVVVGLLTFFAVAEHVTNTKRIADQAEPVIVSARQVQTSLAEANAAAATAFLAGGVENPEQRVAYEAAMNNAAGELEKATRLVGDDTDAHNSLTAMTQALPRYAGLIESARANNRQGYPVGAAYLDTASALLSEEIYKDTDVVANRAAAQYQNSYNHLRGLALIVGVLAVVLTVALVLILIYVQFQLRRRFNRVLNVPIFLATLLALGLTGWMAIGLSGQINSLTTARTDGYEGTRLYLDIRGIGFGAKADEARFLIARGAGESFQDDADQREQLIADMKEKFSDHAGDSGRSSGAEADLADTYAAWAAYVASHDEVVAADRNGERDLAIELALGEADANFAEFATVTEEALAANQARFDESMSRARGAMSGLQIGSLVALTLMAALSVYGLQLRINEYR